MLVGKFSQTGCKLAFLMNSEASITIACVLNCKEHRLPTRVKSGFYLSFIPLFIIDDNHEVKRKAVVDL